MAFSKSVLSFERYVKEQVTAFYSLYALKNLGWSEVQADAFRALVWDKSQYPIREKFIRKITSSMEIKYGNAHT